MCVGIKNFHIADLKRWAQEFLITRTAYEPIIVSGNSASAGIECPSAFRALYHFSFPRLICGFFGLHFFQILIYWERVAEINST